MLIERADFAGLDILAAHRQICWERQRALCRGLLATGICRAYGDGIAAWLEDLAEALAIDKEMLRERPALASTLRRSSGGAGERDRPHPSHLWHHGHGDGFWRYRRRTPMRPRWSALAPRRRAVSASLASRTSIASVYWLWMGGQADHADPRGDGSGCHSSAFVGDRSSWSAPSSRSVIMVISCTPYPAVSGARHRRAFPRSPASRPRASSSGSSAGSLAQ